MREVLITSSVLIVVLLLLRLLFQKTISRRVQYALWGLVLLRLLIPTSLPASPVSVLNFTPAMTVSALRAPVGGSLPDAPLAVPVPTTDVGRDDLGAPPPVSSPHIGDAFPHASDPAPSSLNLTALLPLAWLGGSALMALFFLWSNLRFYFKLRKTRVPYGVEGVSRRVYLCGALASPCLFGGAIYLTPAAISSPERLRHVLAHEETHAAHLDPLWSLGRCLCLALYWFDPLVWVAAIVSGADCELACDEGALRRLNETERLAYGETLLSLIPVRKAPANPLLAATTMTADKRQLKDRLLRITRRRKTVAAALIAVVLLVVAVGACTFTGAKTSKEPENRPLTAEELQYFNEEYFNGVVLSNYINPHNYFISSLYEKPEDIDLFELFYLELPEEFGGFHAPGDEEGRLVFGDEFWDNMPCASYKLTTADMSAFLQKYTGLTLDETNKVGLDQFTYLPQYDAYYWAHGDTNYRRPELVNGEREGGLIRLYYENAWYGDPTYAGYVCLTLKEVEGGYHFVSNRPCEKPVVPTVLPEGDPVLTIPLDTLTPHEEVPLPVERRTDDCAERLGGYSTGEQSVYRYRSTDGKLYAAVVYDSAAGQEGMSVWDAGAFLTLPDNEKASQLNGFSDLFGRHGVILSYSGTREGRGDATFNDYIYFTGDGAPSLLARVYGKAEILDLNGDGVDELVGDDQIFYRKGGKLYEADLRALLENAWPEMSFWESSQWNSYGKYLSVSGLRAADGWPDQSDAAFTRRLYFDGESLLAYPGPRTADHVLEGVTAPDEVLAPMKEYAKAAYESAIEPANRRLSYYTYDDWRISLVERVDLTDFNRTWPSSQLEVYRCAYQLRTPTPWDYHLIGSDVDEEGWLLDTFHTTRYLVFRVENGQRSLLDSDISYPNISDAELQKALLQVLIQYDLLSPGDPSMLPADYAQAVLNAAAAGGSVALTLDTGNGVGGGRYVVSTDAGNGPNRLYSFDTAFAWEFSAEGMSSTLAQGLPTILVESLDGSASLQCWSGYLDVRCTLNGETRWLTAVKTEDEVFDTSIFAFLRLWYDEAEYSGLSDPWLVPDRGQSHEEVAQEMADLIHAAELKVTSGSMFACTYVRSVASVMEDLPDSYFPAAAENRERFGFSFAHIFVPENERSRSGHMPGNTGEYGGEFGPAPEHAFSNGLMGAIYLTDAGWACNEIGTG